MANLMNQDLPMVKQLPLQSAINHQSSTSSGYKPRHGSTLQHKIEGLCSNLTSALTTHATCSPSHQMSGGAIIVQQRPSTANFKTSNSRRSSVSGTANNKENVKSTSQRSLSKNRNNSSGKKKKILKQEHS